METCDAVIVGGGPAGSSCAGKLVAGGLDVLVMDSKAFPRDKPCAGWITPAVVEALQIDVAEYAHNQIIQPITGFRTGLIGGAAIETRFQNPVSYGILRREFDHFLLRRTKARCRLQTPVKQLEPRNGHWVVNESIETPLVVGAGGNFCPVSRFLGNQTVAGSSVVTAQEVEFAVAPAELRRCQIEGEMPELYFCDDLQGYAWCFRKGCFLNIGLGRLDSTGLSQHVQEFCSFLHDSGRVCCKIPARFRGHAYHLYERTQRRLFDQGMLVIGDAAGLADPQSGEGIRPAVESGLIAADVILAAAGIYGSDKLAPYQTQLEVRLGKPRSGSFADWLPNGWLQFLAARLLATRWFSRKVLLERWFLHSERCY